MRNPCQYSLTQITHNSFKKGSFRVIYVCNMLLAFQRAMHTCSSPSQPWLESGIREQTCLQMASRNQKAPSLGRAQTLPPEFGEAPRGSCQTEGSSKTKLGRLSLRARQPDSSSAGGPHVHLFCQLVHVANVRSLVRIRVYAHADELSQLEGQIKKRKSVERPACWRIRAQFPSRGLLCFDFPRVGQ